MSGFAWLDIEGGPWGGGTFYPGGEVVPGVVVKALPHLRGCYVYAADGESIVWESL